MDPTQTSLSVLGPGRACRALARSWVLAGGRLENVIARDRQKASTAVGAIGGGQPAVMGDGPFHCDVLVLGVPDDEIGEAARTIAPHAVCAAAFHLSGALPARPLLEPLGASGVALGSLHPVRPFSGSPDETWSGAFVALEGDPSALAQGERIVRVIGARSHPIDAAGKPLYHAAATLAAGGSLALVSLGTRAWSAAGIPEELGRAALADLAARAAAAGASRGFQDAFTGPVARRDVGTVRAHRAALQQLPDALAVYIALARETLSRTPGRGKEDEILSVLEGREKAWP